MNRRRFLSISAAALVAAPARAETTRWRGVALGAVAEITLRGPGDSAARAITAARRAMGEAEALFSLYRADSTLSRLNRDGEVSAPKQFLALMRLCDRLHDLTGGHFDPTVQPLWAALATGGDIDAARDLVGWSRISVDPMRLAAGQALTLNGIAQGYATDMVTAALAAEGFAETLVNIGEFRAGRGRWKIGVEDPDHGLVRTVALTNRAIATSSPTATMISGQSHILSPFEATPLWSTVSVEADSAALADGLSTGFCLMDVAAIEGVTMRLDEVHKVTLVAANGDIRVLAAI